MKNNRLKVINNIVLVVKIVALLFIASIFFEYFLRKVEFINNLRHQKIILISIGYIFLFLLAIFCLWTFSLEKRIYKNTYKKIIFIESLLFIVIFFVSIVLSGGYDSEYKFIFLFIIISSTIQLGLNSGMIVSIVSSVLILTLDVLFSGNIIGDKIYFKNDLILVGIFILTAWCLGTYVKMEGEHIKGLEELANKDGLTGVFNHRYFYDKLKKKVQLANKYNENISMIFLDIDYFKHYNDLYGHQRGDEVLRNIGKILRNNLRENDIAARYGGEEFSVILPNTNEEEAVFIANKIRESIEKAKFYGEENQPNGVLTVSMGISIYPDKASNYIDLIKSADDALYRAKFFMKNRVETYTSMLDEIKSDIEEKDIELVTSIKTVINSINEKDRYTYGHLERVVFYSRLLAEKLNLNPRERKILLYSAYMHDIGKVNTSKEILIKRTPLTDEEWEILKKHPENGVEIIKSVKSLQEILPVILHHHEKYNGTGYPYKLKGEEIPYLSRALSIVDSFDAMTSNRPYNTIKTYEEAIEEIRRYKGIQFDPEISEKFIEVINENKNTFII